MALLPRRVVPNALTVLRLVLAAAFFTVLGVYRYPDRFTIWGNVAVGLFILAALTDALDGWLARRWDAISTFGRIMDPFCDKILVLGAFIFLAGPRFAVPEWVERGGLFTTATGVYPWMVVIILARELLVTAIRGVVESTGVQFGAKAAGKAKMVLQSVTVPVVIVLVVNLHPSERPWAMWTCNVLVYLTIVVTVWSGLPYITGLRRLMAERKAEMS
jgi:CDP-diacylglycerol--glycerol-3-phosphate 3-phosphatidyltransferase